MEKIAVIGSGAYGSYTINALLENNPNAEITLFEVGDSDIKNEKQIGYRTNILKRNYLATSKGRFFGYGGATNKWGGAILLFTKNDFKNCKGFLKDVVSLDEKYKETVYTKFGFKNRFEEHVINSDLFTKQGIWLGYFRRNLFKYFKIDKRKQVHIESNARVVKFNIVENEIVSVEYIKDGEKKTASFDQYYLTAGAFESHRILLNSGVSLGNNTFKFSDHISQKVFKIYGDTKIGDDEFAFRISGTSFITNRIIGEVDGYSFFANPIYNSDFPFFQNLKKLLFKGQLSFNLLLSTFKDIPSCFGFLWNALVKKRLYVYRGTWDIYIDLENPIENCNIKLSDQKDEFGEKALDLTFEVGKSASEMFVKAKKQVQDFLDANNVKYEVYTDKIEVEKAEDTYHPFGMFFNFNSVEEYYSKFDNMLVVNTGVLPHAGGINSTAAMFPLVEEYIRRKNGK